MWDDLSAAIEQFLNTTTMYRVVLYYLAFLLIAGFGLSMFGVLAFTPVALVVSTILLLFTCWTINTITAYIFGGPQNVESVFITAFILALIITPPEASHYATALPMLFWAGTIAMASKFIFSIGKKHLFNPAAFAVATTAIVLNFTASWWVGNPWMLPFVLVGVLILRKIHRWDLGTAFFTAAFLTIVASGVLQNASPLDMLPRILLETPIFFFTFVMITEPLTTPPTRPLRIAYGVLVGVLFAPAMHIGSLYSTPELALLAGNLFSYAVSPKQKLILKLKERIPIAGSVYDFVFESPQPLRFAPGQYMEWTLGHYHPDNRGIRRYFTIASSPADREVRLGVKFYQSPSSFKKALGALYPGDEIIASHVAGDFTLPKDAGQKLAFIAGGIGVTPFRSMIKHLIDRNERRNIVLLYSNRSPADIAYKDIFDQAQEKLGIETVYVVNAIDPKSVPAWCKTGMINAQMIAEEVPDYRERTFYISGPQVMVDAFRSTLRAMGLKKRQIKTDFFPGLA
ncbi:RnfABCDGE type electron transport complex subunit D [Patescibacteria group bacterium]|nr:RnfABCDGE type electron transport complex subunit D [Patescibacteria group bacterium]